MMKWILDRVVTGLIAKTLQQVLAEFSQRLNLIAYNEIVVIVKTER